MPPQRQHHDLQYQRQNFFPGSEYPLQLASSVEVREAFFDTCFHRLLSLPHPNTRIEVLLVRFVLAIGVTHGRHEIVFLLQHVVPDSGQVGVLQVGVEVDLDHTVADRVLVLLLRRAGAAVKDQEDRLVLFRVDFVLDVFLMLSQQFRVELDVARLVHPMYVAKAGGDREVWADSRERVVDVVDIFWLGVKRVVVNVLVVDTIFLTTGDADFLFGVWSELIKKLILTRISHTISSHCFIGAARFKYFAVVWMFQSTSSSDKSIMWLENKGSPCSLKYFSSASSMPSNQGSSFFAQ